MLSIQSSDWGWRGKVSTRALRILLLGRRGQFETTGPFSNVGGASVTGNSVTVGSNIFVGKSAGVEVWSGTALQAKTVGTTKSRATTLIGCIQPLIQRIAFLWFKFLKTREPLTMQPELKQYSQNPKPIENTTPKINR